MNGSDSQQRGTDMDYKRQAHMLRRHYIDNVEGIVFQRLDVICKDCGLAADSIRTLLARAEAAEDRAEKAEKERDEALDAICTHCGDFPCRKSECPWWRGQKEE